MTPQTAVAIALAFINLAKEIPSVIEILKADEKPNNELINMIREAQASLPVWE